MREEAEIVNIDYPLYRDRSPKPGSASKYGKRYTGPTVVPLNGPHDLIRLRVLDVCPPQYTRGEANCIP